MSADKFFTAGKVARVARETYWSASLCDTKLGVKI